uniref:N(6)-L-threonylcarbamoyladenine synthase n=1 Tax=Spongospora subterranea TaxID=70186 RepID=A0A0H5RB93_9EUKA|eukprot:CRZ11288.1 hypothetical protein [Spongospora subterranea]
MIICRHSLRFTTVHVRQRRTLRVLGIESTCDETGIAVVEDETVVSSRLASQWNLLKENGGVVPILAAREHELNLPRLYNDVFNSLAEDGNSERLKVDAIAVAAGPGLGPCLHVGVEFAKNLCAIHSLPFIAINHLEAHILVNHLVTPALTFPYLAMILSGGHTQILVVNGIGRYDLLGTTQDDAIGEAFDKIAKLLSIESPSGESPGRSLELLAQSSVNRERFAFPVAMNRRRDCHFSYSGLKAAVRRLLEQLPSPISSETAADVAFAFQRAAVAQIESRLKYAFKNYVGKISGISSVVLGGGACCNLAIRDAVRNVAESQNVEFICPPANLCGDNGISIAYTGILKYRLGHTDPLSIGYSARWPIGNPVLATK